MLDLWLVVSCARAAHQLATDDLHAGIFGLRRKIGRGPCRNEIWEGVAGFQMIPLTVQAEADHSNGR